MFSFLKKHAYFFISLILVFLILIYFGIQKQGFHIDEVYTYGLANSYYYPFPSDNSKWLAQSYYLDYLTTSYDQRFNLGSVIYNQARDVHPPLYYLFIHFISSLVPGVFSKWIGLGFNMVVYLASFALLYYLNLTFTKSKFMSAISSLFWALSLGGLSTFLFIRMYGLMTFLVLALVAVGFKFISSNQRKWLWFFISAILVMLGSLSHYYFYIFAFLFTAVVCLHLIFNKEWLKGLIYGFQALLGIGVAYLAFPKVLDHVTQTNRGEEVLENAEAVINLSNINTYIDLVSQDLFFSKSLLSLGLILIIFRSLLTKKTEESFHLGQYNRFYYLIISIVVALYIMVVATVSHYQSARYIYPIYPLISLLFTVALYGMLSKVLTNQKVAKGLGSLFLLTISFFSLLTNEPNYLFLNQSRIEHLENLSQEPGDAIIITDGMWRVTRQIPDLVNYNQVYPRLASEVNLFPPSEQLVDRDQLTVFLYEGLEDSHDFMGEAKSNGYEEVEFLYGFSEYNVYSLSR